MVVINYDTKPWVAKIKFFVGYYITGEIRGELFPVEMSGTQYGGVNLDKINKKGLAKKVFD